MQLIGYVIGIAVIIFVLSLVFKKISGKKTEETGDERRTDPSEGKELHPDRRVQTAEKLQVIVLLPEHRAEETILLWMKRYTDFRLKE